MEEKKIKGRNRKRFKKKLKTKLRCFIIYMNNEVPCYLLLFSFLFFVSVEKKVNNSCILLECVMSLLGYEIESIKRETT
jgi:hypothetical protein